MWRPQYVTIARVVAAAECQTAGRSGHITAAGPTGASGICSPTQEVVMRIAFLLLIVAMVVPSTRAVATEKPVVAMIGTGTLANMLGPVMGQHGYPVIYGSREPARESV